MDRSKEAVALFDKWAREYQDRYMDVSAYAESLDEFCSALRHEKPSILELACGPGNVTKYLLDIRPDCNILGTDLSENMISLARANNPSANFVVMDSREAGKLNTSFDAVVISFLLPYLNREETEQLIADCTGLLAPGGLIYISAIENDYELSGPQTSSQGDTVHMYFYRSRDLSGMLARNDMKILGEWKYTTVMANGAEVVDIVLLAGK